MSDDEVDHELLDLLRKSLGLQNDEHSAQDTGVLSSAEFIADNSVDVALDLYGCRAAAEYIWSQMQQRTYSRQNWSEHELHPTAEDMADEDRLAFIFTVDLLNFSFWSELDEDERFGISYREKKWTGYWSLVAALQRALDEGIEITSPHFWHNGDMTPETIAHVFRSATQEQIPMISERFQILSEAGEVLCKNFDSSVANLVETAEHSAAALVNLLALHFPSFRDECRFERRKVRFLKRAQIFAADLWAAFDNQGYGAFSDIDKITMFADYRIPQILCSLGCISYSPVLQSAIRNRNLIPSGSAWEIQLRGCSIWCVEALKREIRHQHPEAEVNAILIDFFLYDVVKELEGDVSTRKRSDGLGERLEATAEEMPRHRRQPLVEIDEQAQGMAPHHRTRSIWY